MFKLKLKGASIVLAIKDKKSYNKVLRFATHYLIEVVMKMFKFPFSVERVLHFNIVLFRWLHGPLILASLVILDHYSLFSAFARCLDAHCSYIRYSLA